MIKILVDDVSAIEPVVGRDEYLPLTRRIERGRVLQNLEKRTHTFEETFERVQDALRRTVSQLNNHCDTFKQPHISPSDFETQIEACLNNPQSLAPVALSLGDESTGQLAWRYFYLLALFPPNLRAEALSIEPDDSIREHFELVMEEYQQSSKRLIEGSLRYVMRIALFYMGQGVPYLDLVQEGYFGLQRAVNLFSEREGAHFQSYAAQWIIQRITRAIADSSRLIRVPIHQIEKITQLKKIEQEYENDLVLTPHARDYEIIERLGLATQEDTVDNPAKGMQRLKSLRESDAKHYPIYRDAFAKLIVDEQNFEERVELEVISKKLSQLLDKLPERQRNIVYMRNGMTGDAPKTLEVIAQEYNLTRERIRQLEASAHKAIDFIVRHDFGDVLSENDHRIELAINVSRKSLFNFVDDLDFRQKLVQDNLRERRIIEKLIQKHVMGGKRRAVGKHRKSNRADLFAQILDEAGQPLHYNEIYQRALAQIRPEQHFTKESAYTSLFYTNRFRLLGGGIFSLVAWQNTFEETPNGHVFTNCPAPLLPANAHPRAFLESLLVARDLVKNQPNITVMKFYESMVTWAGRDRGNAQDAFDAWYAVGLHEYIHFSRQARDAMRLLIAPEWKLNEIRSYCLSHLCLHVVKMPELLAILDRIGNADTPTLQKLLFGSESMGFDVPMRLTMLAAFEAVRADSGQWRITDVGRGALQANPPQELPDFSIIESPEIAENAYDDWDDLDIFTL